MKNSVLKIALVYLCCLAVFPAFASVYVAVLETISLKEATVSRNEKIFLTDELRTQAAAVLPAYKGFVIMTRENINVMLPPGKTIEECEGSCLAETGKNISADYVAQARVGSFGVGNLTLTVELYESSSGKMLSSFTAKSRNVELLLAEIQSRSQALFGTIPGANMAQSSGGISGVSVGNKWETTSKKQYIIDVVTEPEEGALLSIDGRPTPQCKSTPCRVQLSEGFHKFSLVQERYFDADTVLNVDASLSELKVPMKPNYGKLLIEPKLEYGIGRSDDFTFMIDGEPGQRENILAAGDYQVSVYHNCYEDAHFNAQILVGRTFSFKNKLVPKLGHVSISAIKDDVPQRVPVYVNGREMGETPFDEDVSVCAEITVGENRERMPKMIRAHSNVEWTYEISSIENVLDSGYYLSDVPDNSEYEQIYNSDNSEMGIQMYWQSLAGLGPVATSDDDAEDGQLIGLAFIDLMTLIDFENHFTIGLGGGVGFYYDYGGESSSSSYYGSTKTKKEDSFETSYNGNAIIEGFFSTDNFLFGARFMYIFDSKMSSRRFSLFFEAPFVYGLGIELGYANTDNFMNGAFVTFTFRLPTWKTIEKKQWFKSF